MWHILKALPKTPQMLQTNIDEATFTLWIAWMFSGSLQVWSLNQHGNQHTITEITLRFLFVWLSRMKFLPFKLSLQSCIGFRSGYKMCTARNIGSQMFFDSTELTWVVFIIDHNTYISRTEPIRKHSELTSLLWTLVKLNFSGSNGWETLSNGCGFLRLVNRCSFNLNKDRDNWKHFLNQNYFNRTFSISRVHKNRTGKRTPWLYWVMASQAMIENECYI